MTVPARPQLLQSNAVSRVPVLVAGLWLILAATAGCAPSADSNASSVESAIVEATKGLTAVENKDWKAANEHLTKALKGTGLGADLYEQALLGRARSCVETGDYSAAADDIRMLEFNAANLEPVWLLKTEMALRQGDMTIARSAFAEAKRINPRVAKPQGLN